MESKVLSIMFTDIKGFTQTTGGRSRAGMLDLVEKHDKLLRPIIDHYEGRVIKTIGDAFLVVFESPTNAVLCGMLMQHTLQEYNAKATSDDDRIEIRISINTGEVQLTENDVYGSPVNVASRINSIAECNEVWFTHAVYLSMNKQEVPSSEIGERRLKGVDEPVRVYRVIQDPGTDSYRRMVDTYRETQVRRKPQVKVDVHLEEPERARKPGGKMAAGVVGAMVVVAIVAAVVLVPFGPAWDEQALTYARAKGYPDAWRVIDGRFKADPNDPDIGSVGDEVLRMEIAHLVEAEGHDKALERLDRYHDERPYLSGIDGTIAEVKAGQSKALLARAREFAENDGYDDAWGILDAQFKENPKDEALRESAAAILAREIPFLVGRDGHEKTVERLRDHEQKRAYIPEMKKAILETRQAWAAKLMEGTKNSDNYRQGVNLLWALVEEDPKNPQRLLEYSDLARERLRHDGIVQFIRKALALDAALIADPRVKDLCLWVLKENQVYPYDDEGKALDELVAKNWIEDVREWLRPKVTDPKDVRQRIHAWQIFGAVETFPPGEVFEYHRINLFMPETWSYYKPYHEAAAAYFAAFRGREAEFKKLLGDRTFDAVPVMNRVNDYEKRARPILSTLFYDAIKAFLLKSVTVKDESSLRQNAYEVLQEKGEITPALHDGYQFQNLTEFGAGYLKYGYIPKSIGDALKYLLEGEIPKGRKAAWVKELEGHVEIIGRVKKDPKRFGVNADTLKEFEALVLKAQARVGGLPE